MKKIMMLLFAAVVLSLFVGAASAEDTIGGDRGVIQVSCNVDGATAVLISINGVESEPQTIVNGQAEFSIYVTGTPYSEVKVSASGYETATEPVTMPEKGETSRVTVTLNPQQPIGGDRGVIQVRCNVEGATVELISVSGNVGYTGTIANGQVEFPVYSTATPITQVRVSASGYTTATEPVMMPGSGETSTVTVTLIAPPTPTKSPMGIALFGLIGAVGAFVLLRRD